MKTTDNKINKLSDKQIFVFGCNGEGWHCNSQHKKALRWGAIYGKSEGLHGRTYGIPTINASESLPIDKIKIYVDKFIEFAKSRQDLHFLVTDVSSGVDGVTPSQIAPLFKDVISLDNVSLLKKFIKVIYASTT